MRVSGPDSYALLFLFGKAITLQVYDMAVNARTVQFYDSKHEPVQLITPTIQTAIRAAVASTACAPPAGRFLCAIKVNVAHLIATSTDKSG